MPETWLETWSDAVLEFPLNGTPARQLRALVRFATRAPSSHNSQPWRFRLVGETLELRIDPSRRLPIVDPNDRELLISCGAALEHLRIAAHRFCLADAVTINPDPHDPELVARIRLAGRRDPSPNDQAIFDAISTRHTYRGPMEPRPIAPPLVDQLILEARRAGARLAILDDSARDPLADLVMAADRIQMADPLFRAELAGWLRSGLTNATDGMPGYALEMSAVASVMAPLVVRTFDLGNGRAARDADLVRGSPVLAVLGTDGDSRGDWIRGGQALARVLLLAAAGGVRASYLNQPVEIPALRERLGVLVPEAGTPQLVLRLGYGPEGQATPRRRVSEIWDQSDAS
ncbi:MAG: nitroreductase family protein [Gemmatimonadales bacterium]|nr:nitroreductase family protein [Gemmatimonadales bacterium]